MDKIKIFTLRYKKQIFFSLVGLFSAAGACIGYVTVDRYEIIVRATLGFVVLYMINRQFLSPRKNVNESIGVQLEFPRDLKYLVYGFFLTIIMSWSGIQMLYLMWYLKAIFTNR